MKSRRIINKIPLLSILLLAAFALSIQSASGLKESRESYYIEPEYDRKLEKVLLSMAVDVSSLSLYEGILSSLPDYTEVQFLLPGSSREAIEGQIEKMHPRLKTKLISFNISSVPEADVFLLFPETGRVYSAPISNMRVPRGSVWAQDLFKPARTADNKSYILVSDIHTMFLKTKDKGGKGGERTISDTVYLNRLSI